ncbi:hypothetical protein F4802DRAFT_598772 [Xylaria palmicola]|nr:hypothetical protein F4802DRAFT_598772 [Xylaria palmicola]
MDQQPPPAGGEAKACSLPDNTLHFTVYHVSSNGQNRLVGHRLAEGKFLQDQDCTICSSQDKLLFRAFEIHSLNAGLGITLCDRLAGYIAAIADPGGNALGCFNIFWLRSKYDELKQHYDTQYDASLGYPSPTSMLGFLLGGLVSDTIFFEPLGLDYGDVWRRTVITVGLRDLEFIVLDSVPRDDNRDDDGLLSNNPESTNVSINDPMGHVRRLGVPVCHLVHELSVDKEWPAVPYPAPEPYLPNPAPEPYLPNPPSPRIAITDLINSSVVGEFREEYDKVLRHVRCDAIRKRFMSFASAWKCGVAMLRVFYGAAPVDDVRRTREVGGVLAMLCVCSAMSRTMDKFDALAISCERQGSYFEHFKNDLHRWGLLFRGTMSDDMKAREKTTDLHEFISAVKTIWDVDINGLIGEETSNRFFFVVTTNGSKAVWDLDKKDGFVEEDSNPVQQRYIRYLEKLAENLDQAFQAILELTNNKGTAPEAPQGPSQTQQLDQSWRSSTHGDSGRHILAHRVKNMDQELAFLVTGPASLIFFVFHRWRYVHVAERGAYEGVMVLRRSDSLLRRNKIDMTILQPGTTKDGPRISLQAWVFINLPQ